MFRIEWWLRGIPVMLILAGCAGTPSYKAADCDRFRFKGFNILVCDDTSVGIHCKRICALTDSGKAVTYHPRACHQPGRFGRRVTIFIGRSYLNCLPHELAHGERPNDPAMVEREYPCVGDKRTE